MKRILVITTGGTIACEESGKGLAPAHGGSELLKGIAGCELRILDLFACDSTDISLRQWKALYSSVKNSSGFDGVVILHGTDTLEYTAAMLYYTLSHLNIPVIITGAMLPFSHENSDGPRNIKDAVTVACDGRFKGVYAVFCGRIICGNRVIKVDSRDEDAFRSYDGNDCGKIEYGIITPYCYGEIPEPAKLPESYKKIAVIKLTPFTYELTVPDGSCGAVIESFGAGGVPNDENNWLPNLEKLIKNGVRVVCATQCIYDGVNLDLYPIGTLAQKLGAESTGVLTIEATLTKLMYDLAK